MKCSKGARILLCADPFGLKRLSTTAVVILHHQSMCYLSGKNSVQEVKNTRILSKLGKQGNKVLIYAMPADAGRMSLGLMIFLLRHKFSCQETRNLMTLGIVVSSATHAAGAVFRATLVFPYSSRQNF